MRTSRTRLIAALTALSVTAVACGASEPTPAAPATTSTAPAAADGGAETARAENLFPDIDVLNISDGSSLNLQAELAGGDKPVLLWFWAPH